MHEIIDVQDVSRPRAKRFVAHVAVSTTNKQEILEVIRQVTRQLRDDNEDYCLPGTIKKFGDPSPAHVVRLYVHSSKDNSLIVQSMWIDDKADIAKPKPLEYNDKIDDIGVAWFSLEGTVW